MRALASRPARSTPTPLRLPPGWRVAGWALTMVGNVDPGLGQNYIVDSFMVVVTGGVGKLAGTIWASLGIGGLNKLIEPVSGAVYGKVFILIGVILFLQWRPQGLFAAKGRNADA